ncbi:acyl-CoA carboxylase subunit epsilon [Streptomyces alboniger]|uniref:Acyl-CoA carboxylase subunit epsilon n=1 Tax=Streptomyces alboniger TaxID=132473 RepID=A0A5J6HKK1_STRAD|nr:acyl-CoA carboxylase subunit epsilon [Streptomyces alboniger]QEV19978.1 acyl-CoA carboxylase subunit epsilon [Streptomyces alboniger]
MPTADIRIEKGEVTADELAALTVLLLSRAAAPPRTTATATTAPSTSWRHDKYRAPHSWQG